MRAAVKNAADPQQVGRAETKGRDDLEQRKDDLRQILLTNWGRRYLYETLELTGVHEESFSHKDASLTFFKEGRRAVGLRLEQEIKEADKQGYLKMLAEQMEKEDG